MYRKRMREALAEARAYRDPLEEAKLPRQLKDKNKEAMVAKGGKTIVIDKSDLPVYMAKGWQLAEETINEMNAVNYARKLSSYAVKRGGIDKTSFMKIANSMASANNDTDIKRIGKQVDDMDTEPRDLVKGSIAIHMGPKTFEKMFGDRLTASDIKQYRRMTPSDLAEETITEFKRMSVFIPDPFKRAAAIRDISRFGGGTGFKIDVGSKTIKVDGKGKDLNKFAIDLKNFYGAEIKAESIEEVKLDEFRLFKIFKDGKFVGKVRASDEKAAVEKAYMKLGSASRFTGAGRQSFKAVAEEIELEEKFTIGDYKRLEADNQHDIAAKKLVDMFGTPEDKKEIDAINKRHNKTGYITGPDFKKRTQIVNKYFSKLMP